MDKELKDVVINEMRGTNRVKTVDSNKFRNLR